MMRIDKFLKIEDSNPTLKYFPIHFFTKFISSSYFLNNFPNECSSNILNILLINLVLIIKSYYKISRIFLALISIWIIFSLILPKQTAYVQIKLEFFFSSHSSPRYAHFLWRKTSKKSI